MRSRKRNEEKKVKVKGVAAEKREGDYPTLSVRGSTQTQSPMEGDTRRIRLGDKAGGTQ